MLFKYYLSNKINAPFDDFTLGLQNVWANPDGKSRRKSL